MKNEPIVYVIAGPNGAGKTTFATHFLPRYIKCLEFINPDLIAGGLSPFAPEAAAIEAGRIMLDRIHHLIGKRETFGMETTLSGRTYVSLFCKMKSVGYKIHVFYLWVPSPELALRRIQERVKMGGHNIQEKDVRRRFRKSIVNLFNLYRPLLNSLFFFDNSKETPFLVFEDREGNVTVYENSLYKIVTREAER